MCLVSLETSDFLPLMNSMTRSTLLAALTPLVTQAGPTEPEELLEEERTTFFSEVFSGFHRIDFDHDLLHSDDISVNRSSFLYRLEKDRWNLEATLGYTQFDINYSDPVGATQSANRDEDNRSGGLTLGFDLSDSVSSSIGFTTYDGYADFQSVWISEYYDQFIGIPIPDNYEEADPKGWGLNAGVVWDYDPGVARLSASFGFSNDDIVPAWSPGLNPAWDPILNPGVPVIIADPTAQELDTYSGSLTWEMAVNPRLRTQLNLRYIDVTARDPRLQVRNQWAWAITDELTFRAHLGFAIEDPDFEAYYGGIALNYDINSNWSVTLAGRLYHDTGEVVSAGFNTAAPEIDSSEISATLGWTNGDTSIRIGIGLYDTDYGDLDADNQFFSDLYEDRDYTLGRFAITHQF